jgi:hypothetical protein
MPRILVLMPLGSEVRQFGHSGVLAKLLDRGWEVVAAPKIIDEDIRSQLDSRITLVEMPSGLVPFSLGQALTILDNAHAFKEARRGETGWEYLKSPARSHKQRLLFAAQRRIGCLLSTTSCGMEMARGLESRLLHRLADPQWLELLSALRPDVMLLNVPRVPQLAPALSAADRLGVNTVLLYHTWKDVSAAGRLNHEFARLGVWNSRMRADLLRQNPWLRAERVEIAGCAHFTCVGRKDWLLTESELRARLGARPSSRLLFFPASAPWMVPEEERYIRLLKTVIAKEKVAPDFQIVVRTNPMDERGLLAETLKADFPDVIVAKPDWRWDKPRNWCFQRRDDLLLYNSLLHYAAASVGVPSTVAIECAIADLPTVNLGFDLPGPLPQTGFLRKFWDADFYESVRNAGAVTLASNPVELCEQVRLAISEPSQLSEGRRRLVEFQLGVEPHCSADAAVRVLENVAAGAKPPCFHAGEPEKIKGRYSRHADALHG